MRECKLCYWCSEFGGNNLARTIMQNQYVSWAQKHTALTPGLPSQQSCLGVHNTNGWSFIMWIGSMKQRSSAHPCNEEFWIVSYAVCAKQSALRSNNFEAAPVCTASLPARDSLENVHWQTGCYTCIWEDAKHSKSCIKMQSSRKIWEILMHTLA